MAAAYCGARSALAGISTHIADKPDGTGSMTQVPGAIGDAISTATDLSAAHRGRSREVSAASDHAHVHARQRPLTLADAAAAAATLSRPCSSLAHNSPSPICRVNAGHSAAAAPPPPAVWPSRRFAERPDGAATATTRSFRQLVRASLLVSV